MRDFAERGINLTASPQVEWVNQRLRELGKITLALLFGLGLAYFAWQQQTTQQAENQHQQSELQEKKAAHAQLTQKIEQFKQQPNGNGEALLEPAQIEAFLTLITHIPVKNGGLEIAQLSASPQLEMKLVGKYQNQAEVQQLQDYLIQQQKSVQLEYLHTHENNVEFSLIISEKRDEISSD